ncbi:MAG: DUF5680 domain-containing protein [Ferroplasma sp.]|jgi:hypothetical protein
MLSARSPCTSMDEEEVIKFLGEARIKGYASGKAYSPGRIEGFKEFSYADGKLKYTDMYSGSIFFSGQETIFDNNTPVWGMVYYGGILNDDYDASEVYDFLRKALRDIPADLPLRGKEIFSGTKFVYKNSVQGDIWHFIGYEEIEHMENTIYELHYSGGYIE